MTMLKGLRKYKKVDKDCSHRSDLCHTLLSNLNDESEQNPVLFDSVTFKEYIIFYNNSRYCGGKLKAYNIKWLS